MVANSYNVQKDKDAALSFNSKILAIDPTDATAVKTQEALSGSKQKTKTNDEGNVVKEKTKTDSAKVKVKDGKTKIKDKK